MTNPTANVQWDHRNRGRLAVLVDDGVQLYAGELVGVPDADGLLDHWDNVATSRFLGILLEDVLGDESEGVMGKVDTSGITLANVAVAGTPTQAKLFEKVYCADGNITGLTMTATTSPAIGYLSRYVSASDCDVTLFTPAEAMGGAQ